MIRISAFKSVPPFARGLVRDLRVRWALEEAGLPYEAQLLEPGQQGAADYRAWQPFGQVPAFAENGLSLFESGAIVLHIAEKPEAGETLLPSDPAARARAIQWMFAALNSIEPFVQQLAAVDLFYANEEWAKLRRPGLEEMVRRRLDTLRAAIGDKEWLDGERFTAGDLLMATVLRIPRHTPLVAATGLDGYLERCEARPAFERALAAQLEPFEAA